MSAFSSKAQSSVSTAEQSVPLKFSDCFRSWWVTSLWKMPCLLVEDLWDSVFLKSLSHGEYISMLTTSRPLRCAQITRLEFLCTWIQCFINVRCTSNYVNLKSYKVCALLNVQVTKVQAVQLETWLYCVETKDTSSTMYGIM